MSLSKNLKKMLHFNEQDDDHEQKNRQTAYIAQLTTYRGELIALRTASQSEYDKTIITVCSAYLAATIGFYDKIPVDAPKPLIILAIACWSLALVSIIISFAGSVSSMGRSVTQLDSFLSDPKLEGFNPKRSRWNGLIIFCNVGSLIALIAGIALFGIAIAKGVTAPAPTKNNCNMSNHHEKVTKGFIPPPPPPMPSPAPQKLFEGVIPPTPPPAPPIPKK